VKKEGAGRIGKGAQMHLDTRLTVARLSAEAPPRLDASSELKDSVAFMPKRPLQGHLPQLDGLRTLAVAGVLVSHFGGGGPWGHLGVRLFFVISGYLITGILIGAREGVLSGRETLRRALWVFYARRFLRIFPLYYAVLVVSLLRPLPLRIAPWYFTYGCNILFARNNAWGPLSHFWSLAVEEQFYVVWPLLTLLTPRSWLRWCLVGMVGVSVSWRLCAHLAGANDFYPDVLLPACLDSLAVGALLANEESSGVETTTLRRRLLVALLVGAAISGLASLPGSQSAAARVATFDLGASLVFAWLVFRARLGLGDLGGRFLRCRPMVYIGSISYGVYVFHPFAWNLVARIGLRTLWQSDGVRAVLGVAATLVMASMSWHFFEGPLNRLKRHFAYRRGPSESNVAFRPTSP